MSDYIPQEVLMEILLPLPSKLLIRCSCVSKSWYSLISSPNFISMYNHFNKNKKEKNPQLIIRHYSRIYGKELFALYPDYGRGQSIKHLECPVKSSNGYLLEFVGSCNGLVCLTDTVVGSTPKIVLWNPSLGITIVIPDRHGFTSLACDSIFGIGYNSKNFDYEVVKIWCHYSVIRKVDIFSVSRGSWSSIGAGTKIALPTYFIDKSPQVFVNGNLHWVGLYYSPPKYYVVAFFDVVKKVFGEFKIPNNLAFGHCKLSIVAYGKSLALIQYDNLVVPSYDRCHIWVMNEYGVAESWTKLYAVRLRMTFEKILNFKSTSVTLLARTNGELYLIDHEKGRGKPLKIYGISGSYDADAYMESLVLWNEFNRISRKALSSSAA